MSGPQNDRGKHKASNHHGNRESDGANQDSDHQQRPRKVLQPDYGSSFVPGAGPEHLAPKSLDHFKRGYQERAEQRDKEFYKPATTSGGNAAAAGAAVAAGPPLLPSTPTVASNYPPSRSFDPAHNPVEQQNRRHRSNNGNNSHHRANNNSHHQHTSRPPRSATANPKSDPWASRQSERPTVLNGLNVQELLDALDQNSHQMNDVLLDARQRYPEPFENGKALTALISSAARRRQVWLAQRIWEWMDHVDIPKNTFHFNSMISAAEKAKDFRYALNLLGEMERRNIAKNEVTFSSAISACEKCGEWRAALDLLDRMEREGIQRTAIAYNAAISACEKAMLPQKACDVFRRMKREGIQPSVVSYSALISAAEKGGQWKLALEILDEMKANGFPGNVVAYSAAISALAKGQQGNMAMDLFREIQAFGGQPSIVTYNATMTALEKSLEWERALDLFDEMKMRDLPITVVSYGSAISACDKGLQYRQCLEYLDEMTELGIPKNVIIFGAAMSCMEKCCRADIGFQLMERMRIEGIQPNVHVYNSAISACARSNLWEKGYELFREMDEVGVRRDVVTYNAILDAVASQIKLGRMLFEEGVKKGFYARVSRLGEHWFELDLHFLSLGGGEIALGWWFEECLVPYLVNTELLQKVKSISIVTGYGKTRTRGRRQGDDGMRKRCKAMLRFMKIKEVEQANAGRIHVDKEALIEEVKSNGGKVVFDMDAYVRWKEMETTANVIPDVQQKVRARFKPLHPGTTGPPFVRIETDSTSPEFRLENMKHSPEYERYVSTVQQEMPDERFPVADSGEPVHQESSFDSRGHENGTSRDGRNGGFEHQRPMKEPRGGYQRGEYNQERRSGHRNGANERHRQNFSIKRDRDGDEPRFNHRKNPRYNNWQSHGGVASFRDGSYQESDLPPQRELSAHTSDLQRVKHEEFVDDYNNSPEQARNDQRRHSGRGYQL